MLRTLLLLTLAATVLGTGSEANPDWPQWRGPNRDGISAQKGLLTHWPDAGPKVLWSVAAGAGYSGMSVKDGKLVTTFAQDGAEFLLCYATNSGQELWRYRLDSQFNNSFGNGPRSTPSIDGNRAFALSAKGMLAAVNVSTGAEIWQHNLGAEYGGRMPTWGVATSPLVYGNLLIVDVGGRNDYGLVAFDKRTGKVVWKSPEALPGYSAPILVTVGGVKQVLSFTGNSLLSVDPANGKRFWNYPWTTSYDVNAATPIFIAPDKVFISSGYGKGGAVLKMIPEGNTVRVERVWASRVMRNHFSTSILHDGHLYGFDEGTLKCVDLKTQKATWRKRGMGKGSLIYADGHLIVLSERGKLVLVKASPKQYVETASAQVLSGRCWTLPSIGDGKLFLRNQKKILCMDLFVNKS